MYIFLQLSLAEQRLSKVEECDCTKSCRSDLGIVREDGSSWAQGCQTCSCVVSGKIANSSFFEMFDFHFVFRKEKSLVDLRCVQLSTAPIQTLQIQPVANAVQLAKVI